MTPAAVLTAALAAGLLGSLHCTVMCGPVAVAGCRRDGRTSARAIAGYLGGRFASYAAFGAAFGLLGEHALCVLPLGTVQAIALSLLAAFALHRGVRLLVPARPRPVAIRRPTAFARLSARVAAVWPRRGLALGLATGFLPCGMLLPAWALAAGSGSAPAGALTMIAFAAATAPALVLPLAGGKLLRRVPARAQGAAWCALAIWVALRPLLMAAHHH
jgi:sulfite exporter TauE/SafE